MARGRADFGLMLATGAAPYASLPWGVTPLLRREEWATRTTAPSQPRALGLPAPMPRRAAAGVQIGFMAYTAPNQP